MIELLRREVAIALVLGLCAPWIVAWLSLHGAFYAHVSVVQVLVTILNKKYEWSLDEIRPYSRLSYAILSSLTYGFVLGFPLGLLSTRRWFISWLAFLSAFLLAHWFASLASPFGFGLLFANLLLPEFWRR